MRVLRTARKEPVPQNENGAAPVAGGQPKDAAKDSVAIEQPEGTPIAGPRIPVGRLYRIEGRIKEVIYGQVG